MNKVCIVGSADSLTGKGLGGIIDTHDVIVRINQPPIFGFEEDVGSRITHSFISPWQIVGFQEENEGDARKESFIRRECFERLREEKRATEIVLATSRNGLTYDFNSFYKEIASLIGDRTALNFLCWGDMKRWRKRGFTKKPTNGTFLVEYYLRLYGNISIAGFGHPQDESQEGFYHYWEGRNLGKVASHRINQDVLWLKWLHKNNKINILELNESHNTL